MQFLISKISYICQEIHNIKQSRKKQFNFTPIQEGQSIGTEEETISTGDLGTLTDHHTVETSSNNCQEIGLVGVMFFFELLFFYVSLAISLYVSFLNLFSIIYFLIC